VMSRQPQDAELVRYLALLAGREPAGGLLEIRYRHPDRHQRMHQHWHPTTHPAAAAREILELAEHTDVYVGVTPRRHRHGGRSAIHRAWVLWADLDQLDGTDPGARVPVAPGVVISSGIIRSRRVRARGVAGRGHWRHVVSVVAVVDTRVAATTYDIDDLSLAGDEAVRLGGLDRPRWRRQ
jgi:hypothetical protein